jgi:hypothetical protein
MTGRRHFADEQTCFARFRRDAGAAWSGVASLMSSTLPDEVARPSRPPVAMALDVYRTFSMGMDVSFLFSWMASGTGTDRAV